MCSGHKFQRIYNIIFHILFCQKAQQQIKFVIYIICPVTVLTDLLWSPSNKICLKKFSKWIIVLKSVATEKYRPLGVTGLDVLHSCRWLIVPSVGLLYLLCSSVYSGTVLQPFFVFSKTSSTGAVSGGAFLPCCSRLTLLWKSLQQIYQHVSTLLTFYRRRRQVTASLHVVWLLY